MTNLDLKVLLFFLASYKTLALCGHPVIEKVQKIHLYGILRAIFEGFINSDHSFSLNSQMLRCHSEFYEPLKVNRPVSDPLCKVLLPQRMENSRIRGHF